MIFNIFIQALTNLSLFAIQRFPDGNDEFAGIIGDGIYNIKSWFAPYNWIIPVDTIYWCMNATLALIATIILFFSIRWIISIITFRIIH
jgi:hypothetical protein